MAVCSDCDYVANTEKAEASSAVKYSPEDCQVKYFLSQDHESLVACYWPVQKTLNPLHVCAQLDMDLSSIEPSLRISTELSTQGSIVWWMSRCLET